MLDSDVVCTAQDPVGLVIGANDIKLRLNGYTIQGAGAAGTDGVADDGTARSGVTVKGGAIAGFEDGVDLDVSNSNIVNLRVSDATGVGIAVRGNGNYFHKNEVDMTTGAGFAGIEVVGDDNFLWGNTVTGTPAGQSGRRNRRPREQPTDHLNLVDGCAFDGVIVDSYTDGMVARNTVTNCDIGYTPSGTGIRIQTNEASGNCHGMVIDDPAALVRWNHANNNCSNGIFVMQPGATLFKNLANNNLDYGIDAPLGHHRPGPQHGDGQRDRRLPRCHLPGAAHVARTGGGRSRVPVRDVCAQPQDRRRYESPGRLCQPAVGAVRSVADGDAAPRYASTARPRGG